MQAQRYWEFSSLSASKTVTFLVTLCMFFPNKPQISFKLLIKDFVITSEWFTTIACNFTTLFQNLLQFWT